MQKRNEVAEVWWSQKCKMPCTIVAILSEILNLTAVSEDVLAPKRFRFGMQLTYNSRKIDLLLSDFMRGHSVIS